MSFFGGFLGGFLGCFYYLKKIKLDWKKFADLFAIVIAGAIIFGRIANFLNGELVGTKSDLLWCINYDVCRHPYQLYAAFSHLVLFAFLLFFRKIKNIKSGQVFYAFLVGYSILRFITDFFRQEDIRILGLSVWQYTCLLVLILFVCFLFYDKFIKNKKE